MENTQEHSARDRTPPQRPSEGRCTRQWRRIDAADLCDIDAAVKLLAVERRVCAPADAGDGGAGRLIGLSQTGIPPDVAVAAGLERRAHLGADELLAQTSEAGSTSCPRAARCCSWSETTQTVGPCRHCICSSKTERFRSGGLVDFELVTGQAADKGCLLTTAPARAQIGQACWDAPGIGTVLHDDPPPLDDSSPHSRQ
ncbi:hypothetical protein [Streptomyces sp. Inha503]|uniref:hypothetical protein n=1 Tax=Streptomyces sp. Inha503 TaxID=3383314 RepID=UPI0039A23690